MKIGQDIAIFVGREIFLKIDAIRCVLYGIALPSLLEIGPCSEGRESRSRLGLETEGTETLGLVSVSYKILELVSSRSRLG